MPNEDMDVPLLLGVLEVSRRLQVSSATVKAWADAGRIPHFRDSARKRLFISVDIDTLAQRLKAEKKGKA